MRRGSNAITMASRSDRAPGTGARSRRLPRSRAPRHIPAARFFPFEGVHFYPHLRAEFTSEDGAGGARLGDEASVGAAPRGDGGDLAERTADGTHRGHLVLSCCEVSLIRSIVALPAPACAGRLGFFFDCLRVLTCLGAHFPKTCTTPPERCPPVAGSSLLRQPSSPDQTTHVTARQDPVLFRCLTLGGPSSPWRSTVRPPPTVR